MLTNFEIYRNLGKIKNDLSERIGTHGVSTSRSDI